MEHAFNEEVNYIVTSHTNDFMIPYSRYKKFRNDEDMFENHLCSYLPVIDFFIENNSKRKILNEYNTMRVKDGSSIYHNYDDTERDVNAVFSLKGFHRQENIYQISEDLIKKKSLSYSCTRQHKYEMVFGRFDETFSPLKQTLKNDLRLHIAESYYTF
jgi:hypothetical protein